MQPDRNTLLDRLSARERQVLELTAGGLSLRQIGALMGVSSSTVEIYRNRVMVKLDIYELAGLVRFARLSASSALPRLQRRAVRAALVGDPTTPEDTSPARGDVARCASKPCCTLGQQCHPH